VPWREFERRLSWGKGTGQAPAGDRAAAGDVPRQPVTRLPVGPLPAGPLPAGPLPSGPVPSAVLTGMAGSVRSPRTTEATFWKRVIGTVGGTTLPSSSRITSPRTTLPVAGRWSFGSWVIGIALLAGC
jgi:hypothetical protein